MEIVYDGRKDQVRRNDLVLFIPYCDYEFNEHKFKFVNISKVIDFGRLMVICSDNKVRVFDKFSGRVSQCSLDYVYFLFYAGCIYEWYINNGHVSYFVSCEDYIHRPITRENLGKIKLPLDPVTVLSRTYSGGLHNASYGIDLMAIHKSRGIRVTNNFADILVVC